MPAVRQRIDKRVTLRSPLPPSRYRHVIYHGAKRGYIVQVNHCQFGGVFHCDEEAAEVVADWFECDVEALRKPLRRKPAATQRTFKAMFSIYRSGQCDIAR